MLRIYNTMTGAKEDFVPREKGKVGMYVCGVTVYDLCHIGHGRTFVCFDVIVRYLRYLGYQVRFVRNITDVDDKIIRRSREHGEDMAALTGAEKGVEDGDAAIRKCLDKAETLLNDPALPRDGYYAFVCEKCAPTFAYYGYYFTAKELEKRAAEIYGR